LCIIGFSPFNKNDIDNISRYFRARAVTSSVKNTNAKGGTKAALLHFQLPHQNQHPPPTPNTNEI
jgi:hypothetical protein